MITEEKTGHWQIKTTEGTHYKSCSLEAIFQWILDNRIGAEDLLFSPERHDWIPLFTESLLKCCFWQLRTIEGKIYGPVSLGELKQLFINSQITAESEVALWGITKQWSTIRDLPALDQWLVEEYSQPIDYRQFLNRLNEQFVSRKEMPKRISRKEAKLSEKTEELKRKFRDQGKQIKDFELKRAQLGENLETERRIVEEVRVKYNEIESRHQTVLNELQKLKSELHEKTLFIEELNKQMAQMEVVNTIKNDEVRELREYVESTKGDIPAQSGLLQKRLQDEEKRVKQLQFKKEELQQDAKEEKQIFLQKQGELGEDIKRLTNEKEGLQNFIYTLQDELTRITSDKEQLEQTISEPTESLKSTIDELTQAKEGLEADLAEKNRILEEYRAGASNEANRLIEENKDLEDRIQELREEIVLSERRLREISQTKGIKDAQIQALLKNKEQLMKALAVNEESISQLEEKVISKDGVYKVEQERSTQQLEDMAEELEHREELIKRLEQKLDGLKWEYSSKIKESEDRLAKQTEELAQKTNTWEEMFQTEKGKWEKVMQQLGDELAQKEAELKSQILEKERLEREIVSQKEEWEKRLSGQAEEFGQELTQKTNAWEETLQTEKRRWEEIQQQFEGELAQKKAKLEAQVLEKESLQREISDLREEWEMRVAGVREDARKQYEELVEERENLQTSFASRLHDLETEVERLQLDLSEANKGREELLQDKDILQQELTQRERFIEEIKKESARQKQTLMDREEEFTKANNTIGELEDKIAGLTSQVQNELDIQNSLRGEITAINEELSQVRHILEQLDAEKEHLKKEGQRQKEDFNEKEKYWEQELEELRRNWEHAIEENRTIQRQFYLEKQKFTKEYTESINKQVRLEKRNQLEREITDRTRMKEELERLYNFLKDNLEGLQKGSLEIQSSLQQIQSDIDNRRLSVKYISEAEKRGEKKAQFPKKEFNNKAINNTPTEE